MNHAVEQDKYHELCYYTLAHRSPAFIHQHVDAYTVQHADASTKPIAVAFALIGLYLHIERGYSGREVQRAHMRLAKQRKRWPRFPLPEVRGNITVVNVVAAPPGAERDEAIEKWCRSVWDAWSRSRELVVQLVKDELHGVQKKPSQKS